MCADALTVHSADLELASLQPVLLVFAAESLEHVVFDDGIPQNIGGADFDVAGGELVVEEGGEHDDDEILIADEILKLKAFVIAIVPFAIVVGLVRVELVKPVVVVFSQFQVLLGNEDQRQQKAHSY